MRAVEKGVDVCAAKSELLIETQVDGIEIRAGVQAERDAALIGNNEGTHTGLIELCNGLRHTGEELKFIPTGNVVAFREFAVDDTVTIKKDRFNGLRAVLEVGVHDRASITRVWV